MKKAVTYIPIKNNEGEEFSESLIEELKNRIIEISGGLTEKGKVKGYWQNPAGEILEDINRQLDIGIQQEDLDRLRELLRDYKDILEQESMYLEYNGEIEFL